MSAKNNCPHSRRAFLRISLGVASAGLAALRAPALRAQNLPHVSPNEALAKALGYVTNAARVDRAKFPTYKPGDTCAKCRFYQGKPGETWGPCQLFMGKSVDEHGWCASYMLKT